MTDSFESIQDVVDAKLCSGCGACAYLQPASLEMVDVPEEGLRPKLRGDAKHDEVDTREALEACPGIELSHPDLENQNAIDTDLVEAWGPILSMWEGGASDEQLRFAGSSGGAASALALYALEHLDFRLLLHVGANPNQPYKNQTVVSTTRAEVLNRTGSRYAPASPCEGLSAVERSDGPCVFIGKPCDVAAAQKARRHRPRLDENLALTIAFFCAGTPSTNGTLELLRSLGVRDESALTEVRYRGNGWPGRFVAKTDGHGNAQSCTYEESWGGVLSHHVQWRCKLCLDHTGEFGDIAVGDPWYRPIEEGEIGSSLIVARTPAGMRHVEAAIAAGALKAVPADPELLPRSQPNLLRTRGEVWGRVLGSRLVGARTPMYRGLPSFKFWMSEVPFERKLRSVLGSARRSVRQGIAFRRFLR